jgi:hypothetical protein
MLKAKVQQHLKYKKLVGCSYDDNFKLMVIKYVEETSNCAAAQKFCDMQHNV